MNPKCVPAEPLLAYLQRLLVYPTITVWTGTRFTAPNMRQKHLLQAKQCGAAVGHGL